MIKRYHFALVAVILSLIGAIALYFLGYIRLNHPDPKRFPIQGIDISHHQGEIDWELLKTENVGFVYIKATEGGDFRDPRFHTNWREASKSGIVRGAYHFFTFCRSGGEQAANFIQTVPVEAGVLPPVIDFEFVGNCSDRPVREALRRDILSFAEQMELAYGQRPVFYVTYASYDKYLDGALEGYGIWIRDIFGHPSLRWGKDWTFWQFANRARVRGISGPVDLNVFNGTAEQLRGLLK